MHAETPWSQKGCHLCRQLWESGTRPQFVAEDMTLHARLYQCVSCHAYWEETERFPATIPESQARALFPRVFNTHAYLRILIYCIQFNRDPLLRVDDIYQMTVTSEGLEEVSTNFLAAIRRGLASQDRLAALLPQKHSEAVIREFLFALQQKIENPVTKL